MKDMGETSYVIGMEMHKDMFNGTLQLSQKAYIEKILERFRIKDCVPTIIPIVKREKFNQSQCPQNELEREQIKSILDASTVGNLMYA